MPASGKRPARSAPAQTRQAQPTDWRVYRPAIWLAFLGIALLLAVNVVAGVVFIGAGIGVGAKITRGRRRQAAHG